MQNASAADDDDTEYEADGEDDECNENATILAIPRTRARIRLLGLMLREPPDSVSAAMSDPPPVSSPRWSSRCQDNEVSGRIGRGGGGGATEKKNG